MLNDATLKSDTMPMLNDTALAIIRGLKHKEPPANLWPKEPPSKKSSNHTDKSNIRIYSDGSTQMVVKQTVVLLKFLDRKYLLR